MITLTSSLRHWSFLLPLAALLVSCASTQSREVSLSEDQIEEVESEVVLGREMAARLLLSRGSYRGDSNAEEYVNLVGQALSQLSGRPEILFRFGILDTDSVESFSTPGGYVLVSRGLLAELRSESELAALLAVEIAHVNERRLLARLAGSRGRSPAAGRLVESADAPSAASGVKVLIEDGWTKDELRQADEAAASYLVGAGYDAAALLTVLKRWRDARPSATMGKAFGHLSDRTAALESFLIDKGLSDGTNGDTAVLEARFLQSLASVRERPGRKK